MPKLLLFVPCEKVLVNETDHTTTLIVVLENITISIPTSEESKLPPDAQIPYSWHILALWQSQPQDEDRQFEMRFEAEMPKGEKQAKLSGAMPISFEADKPNFRNVINVLGFPVVPAGTCLLKLYLREIGDENDWTQIADYPIVISRPA